MPVIPEWVIGHWNGHFWKVANSIAQLSDQYFTDISNEPVQVTPEVQSRVCGECIS